MNILYLIGNGFDLAQDLKTRYIDFYPYYISRQDITNPAIKELCQTIDANYETWADMELALGEYTSNLKKDDFEDVYYDLSACLREYLRNEQDKFNLTGEVANKITYDILTPYECLYGRDRDALYNILNQERHIHNVNIVTFNYTNLVDSIFDSPKYIGAIIDKETYLRGIHHVHGGINSTMIMGVNDSSQIKNSDFIHDEDVADILIKPKSNDAIRSAEAVACSRLILQADIIILFGLSLGDTDKVWWQEIADAMVRNHSMYLVIYSYLGGPIDMTRGQKLGAKIRGVRNNFISKVKFHESLKESIEERIFVSFDHQYLSTKGI